MKVLLVTENLGSGGAERQLSCLAVLLSQVGHEVTVVTWLDKNFFGDYLSSHNVQHVLLKVKGRLARVKKLSSLFRQLQPDGVISFLPMANETCVLASLFYPVKLIVSERSFTTNWGLRRKITNLLYRRASYIVANSNNEAENIRKHCPQLSSKTISIPNFVDIEKFRPLDRQSPAEGQKLKFVGVGRVIPTKNLLNLVEAMAHMRDNGIDFILKWYGDTYDKSYLNDLKSLIADRGLCENFIIMGESSKISAAYNDADYFIMPSVLEGYPNVLVEAMATGLPVACSDVCEHPFIVTEGENGFLFNPLSIASMTGAIMKLCALTEKDYLRISNNNRSKVITNNSEKTFLLKYVQLLEG